MKREGKVGMNEGIGLLLDLAIFYTTICLVYTEEEKSLSLCRE